MLLLLTEMNLSKIGINAQISNYIHVKQWALLLFHFLTWTIVQLDYKYFTDFFKGLVWLYVTIGWGNGMMPSIVGILYRYLKWVSKMKWYHINHMSYQAHNYIISTSKNV